MLLQVQLWTWVSYVTKTNESMLEIVLAVSITVLRKWLVKFTSHITFKVLGWSTIECKSNICGMIWRVSKYCYNKLCQTDRLLGWFSKWAVTKHSLKGIHIYATRLLCFSLFGFPRKAFVCFSIDHFISNKCVTGLQTKYSVVCSDIRICITCVSLKYIRRTLAATDPGYRISYLLIHHEWFLKKVKCIFSISLFWHTEFIGNKVSNVSPPFNCLQFTCRLMQ